MKDIYIKWIVGISFWVSFILIMCWFVHLHIYINCETDYLNAFGIELHKTFVLDMSFVEIIIAFSILYFIILMFKYHYLE